MHVALPQDGSDELLCELEKNLREADKQQQAFYMNDPATYGATHYHGAAAGGGDACGYCCCVRPCCLYCAAMPASHARTPDAYDWPRGKGRPPIKSPLTPTSIFYSCLLTPLPSHMLTHA